MKNLTLEALSIYDPNNFKKIELPYSCKLLMQELQCMNIAPRFITEINTNRDKLLLNDKSN